jgi:hypothetical protein
MVYAIEFGNPGVNTVSDGRIVIDIVEVSELKEICSNPRRWSE